MQSQKKFLMSNVIMLASVVGVLSFLAVTVTGTSIPRLSINVLSGLPQQATGSYVASGTGTTPRYYHPGGISRGSSDSTLYISDHTNHMVREFNLFTSEVTGTAVASLTYPSAIVWDSVNNRHFIAQVVWSPANGIKTLSASNVLADFVTGHAVYGVLLWGSGGVIFSSASANKIFTRTSTGTVTHIIGSGTPGCPSTPTAALSANIRNGMGLAFDSRGNLYYGDYASVILRSRASDYQTETVLGTCGAAGAYPTNDAAGANAKMKIPTGLFYLPSHDVLVCHGNGHYFFVDPHTFQMTSIEHSLTSWPSSSGRWSSTAMMVPQVSWSTMHPAWYKPNTFFTRSGKQAVVEVWAGKLAALYRLAGNGRDQLGSNDLTSYGSGLSATTDRHGGISMATSFDGTTNAVGLIPTALMTHFIDWTICFWAKVPGSGDVTFLSVTRSGDNDHVKYERTAANGVRLTYDATTASYTTPALSTTAWQHHCIVKEGQELRLYLDGHKKASTGGMAYAKPHMNPVKVAVGQSQTTGGYSVGLSGSMQDLYVWDYGMLDHEVRHEYITLPSATDYQL